MDVVHEGKKSGKMTELASRSIGAEKLYLADDKVVLNFKSALQNLLLLFFTFSVLLNPVSQKLLLHPYCMYFFLAEKYSF